jgi:ribA/ribD-fused uncharacterized protein
MIEPPYFFWGGICSQWLRAPITIDGTIYNCNEQYMMAEKARLFGDMDALQRIMLSGDPRNQKAIGREVKGFDPVVWTEICRLVVYRANLAKFGQNNDLWVELMKLGDREIVEASPEDRIWGIGLHESDDRVHDRTQWRGTNWLGIAIMQARSDLKALNVV